MATDLQVGAVVLIDGKGWEVVEIDGDRVTGNWTNDEDGKVHLIHFRTYAVTKLTAGLYGIPGRIEPTAPATVVLEPGVIDPTNG